MHLSSHIMLHLPCDIVLTDPFSNYKSTMDLPKSIALVMYNKLLSNAHTEDPKGNKSRVANHRRTIPQDTMNLA